MTPSDRNKCTENCALMDKGAAVPPSFSALLPRGAEITSSDWNREDKEYLLNIIFGAPVAIVVSPHNLAITRHKAMAT